MKYIACKDLLQTISCSCSTYLYVSETIEHCLLNDKPWQTTHPSLPAGTFSHYVVILNEFIHMIDFYINTTRMISSDYISIFKYLKRVRKLLLFSMKYPKAMCNAKPRYP